MSTDLALSFGRRVLDGLIRAAEGLLAKRGDSAPPAPVNGGPPAVVAGSQGSDRALLAMFLALVLAFFVAVAAMSRRVDVVAAAALPAGA